MNQLQKLNEVNIKEVKKCFPQRAVLTPRKPKEGRKTNGSFAIQVTCNPRMGDAETQYCMESVKQIIPVQEFYSETQGADIWIYWVYDKDLPVTFSF